MAKREPQPIPETPDSSGEEIAQESPKQGGRLLARLLLITLTLGPAVAGAWLAYFYYPTLAQATQRFYGTNHDTSDDKARPIKYGQFMELQGFIINPAGTGGTRYLMVNLGLESANASTLEELKEKEVVVRDTILKLLGQRTVDELADIGLRTQLKQELRDAVNTVLQKGKIDRVYFTQYVLQ